MCKRDGPQVCTIHQPSTEIAEVRPHICHLGLFMMGDACHILLKCVLDSGLPHATLHNICKSVKYDYIPRNSLTLTFLTWDWTC